MSGVQIQVQGLEALKKKYKDIPQSVTAGLDAELHALSEDYVSKAVEAAPRNNGILIQGISAIHETLNHEVVSQASYSAYVEFGTRAKVSVPADLQAYASQFRGSRGSSVDAKKAIYDWCKAKGIPPEAWYPIFKKIMTVGINPHPFFFIHLPWARSEVQKRSEAVVKKALG